ncbi:hypothetical protein VTO73DRAFT_1385 [Trametes versicolor]
MSSVPLPATIASSLHTFETGIGAWLVGTFLSTLIAGMTLQQMFRYFRLYPSDPTYLKAWVVVAVLLQLVTTALSMHVVYYYLVTHYLDPTVFTKKDVWTSSMIPIFGPITNLVAEAYFARRVYLIGRLYRYVALSAMIMILASCGFYFAVAAQSFALSSVISSANTGGWLPTVSSALLFASDFQLTVVLVYYLYRSRTGLRRTNSMLDILIAYAMSTGKDSIDITHCVHQLKLLLVLQGDSSGAPFSSVRPPPHRSVPLIPPRPSFLNVVSLILSIANSHNIVYSTATLVVKSVYTSSFLTALNTRQMVRSRGELYESEDLADGIVLGETDRDPAAVAPRVKDPVQMASIAFARHPSGTQASDVDEVRGEQYCGEVGGPREERVCGQRA